MPEDRRDCVADATQWDWLRRQLWDERSFSLRLVILSTTIAAIVGIVLTRIDVHLTMVIVVSTSAVTALIAIILNEFIAKGPACAFQITMQRRSIRLWLKRHFWDNRRFPFRIVGLTAIVAALMNGFFQLSLEYAVGAMVFACAFMALITILVEEFFEEGPPLDALPNRDGRDHGDNSHHTRCPELRR